MKRIETLAGITVLGLAMAGCGGSNSTTLGNSSYGGDSMNPQAQQQTVSTATQALQDKNAQQVTIGLNKFGLGLFAAVQKTKPNQNICVSPVSVGAVMGLLYNGASGETQKEFAKVLEVGKLSADQINDANKNLQSLLTNIDPAKVDLKIANSVWVDSSEPVSPDYLQKTQSSYSAKVTTLDFKAPDAPSTINDWVRDSTKGKIPTIIQQVPSDAKLYAINAVYFNGTWQRPFDKTKTQPQTFHLSDGSTEQTPMMNESGSFSLFSTSDATGIALPYGTGRLEMDLVMPAGKLDVPGLLKKLNMSEWADWMKAMKQSSVQVMVPSFQVECSELLNAPLKSLGLDAAFDPTKADFTPMIAKNGAAPSGKLYLSEVKHKTFIDVNEQGTEAAAATSGQITATAVLNAPAKFTADHPFLFVIRDTTTGTFLFEGVVQDPKLLAIDDDAPKKSDKDKASNAKSSTNQPSNSQAANSAGVNQGTSLPASSPGK